MDCFCKGSVSNLLPHGATYWKVRIRDAHTARKKAKQFGITACSHSHRGRDFVICLHNKRKSLLKDSLTNSVMALPKRYKWPFPASFFFI